MFSKFGPAYTEIGQIVLTNGITYGNEAAWATKGLDVIAEVIAERRGSNRTKLGFWPMLTLNDVELPFENNVFAMRSYCRCDGGLLGHEDFCPPNFAHQSTGIEISWYEDSSRGITANVEGLTALEWHRIVNQCVESVVAIELS